MRPIFDLQKLDELLKDYYTVTEIRITVFDENFNELTAYPKKRAALCERARLNPDIDTKCRECDKNACKVASKAKTPYIYKCHLGLTEIIFPLIVNDEVRGYLFFAHIFSFKDFDEGVNAIYSHIAKYGFDVDEIRGLCEKMPLKSNEYLNSAANLLNAIATYLCLKNIAVSEKSELWERIDEYIKQDISRDISPEILCSKFNVGRTKLYHVIKDNAGCGLAEYVKKLRLHKAKLLLENDPDTKISKVAESCGFFDYNYFIANFRNAFGLSPRKYANTFISSGKK